MYKYYEFKKESKFSWKRVFKLTAVLVGLSLLVSSQIANLPVHKIKEKEITIQRNPIFSRTFNSTPLVINNRTIRLEGVIDEDSAREVSNKIISYHKKIKILSIY